MGQHKNKASLNGVSLMPNDNSDTQGSNFPLFVACNLPRLLMSEHVYLHSNTVITMSVGVGMCVHMHILNIYMVNACMKNT